VTNRNTLYATIVVDELARSGLQHVVIAPGSRHTPLVLAFAEHDAITVHSQLDERSAAFYAMGLALGSDQPVAVCCTSGTAGANMYPAVIEAHQSRVPLIILTGDRPPELRHSGANQTIDQIKLFGDYALWFVDMALPEADPPAVAIRNLRTTANRAYTTANGLRKGVVHLNFPFRKPLEPTPVEGDVVEVPAGTGGRSSDEGFVMWTPPGPAGPVHDQLLQVEQLIRGERDGVVICGNNARLDDLTRQNIASFAQVTGYPMLLEPFSAMRWPTSSDITGIGAYDTFLAAAQIPEANLIIRFGDVPLSKSLNSYLLKSQPETLIQVSENGHWADDQHLTTHFVQSSVNSFTNTLADMLRSSLGRKRSALSTQYTALESTTWNVIEREMQTGGYFDGGVVYDIVDLIPDGSTLFAGNSLPVRLLDQFARPAAKPLHIFANRGASGIDGNISTALGIGAAWPDRPLAALIGDVTFYHDMNGLLAVRRCGVPVTIVLLNNDGGGIFHRLPVRDYEPAFTDLFVTPHGLDFSHAAALYGLEYVRADTRSAFRHAFLESLTERRSRIIEVRTDPHTDLARRDAIVAATSDRIDQL
jgi:2-succinyl-5-enolpyruvyl-6-hydroxy-3-cyclohexene-1-carboxylate synthase